MVGIICDTVVFCVNAAVDYGQIFVFINGNFDYAVYNLNSFYCICCCSKTFTVCAFLSLYSDFSNCANLGICCVDCYIVFSDCNCICTAFNNFTCQNVVINICYCQSAISDDVVYFDSCPFETGCQLQFDNLICCEIANCCFDFQFSFQLCCFIFSNFCHFLQCCCDTSVQNCCEYQIIGCYAQIVGINGYCSFCVFGCLCQTSIQFQDNLVILAQCFANSIFFVTLVHCEYDGSFVITNIFCCYFRLYFATGFVVFNSYQTSNSIIVRPFCVVQSYCCFIRNCCCLICCCVINRFYCQLQFGCF